MCSCSSYRRGYNLHIFNIQLEDDVVTKLGYLSTIKNFVVQQRTHDWILLEFSALGFIGK